MHRQIFLIIFATSLLLAATGCAPAPSEPEAAAVDLPDNFVGLVSYVDAPTVREWLADGAPLVVLDVRTAREFAEDGRAPGALLLSYKLGDDRVRNGRFLAEAQAAIAPDQRVVVLCASGTRASHAAWELSTQAGFSDVHVLAGGYNGANKKGYGSGEGWKAAGLPLLFNSE